jgi:hypothetical protein
MSPPNFSPETGHVFRRSGLMEATALVSAARALVKEITANAAARIAAPITGRLIRLNDFMMFIFVR